MFLKPIPAGNAKNEIPHNAQILASSFPDQVTGITSPYPIVQRVIFIKNS